MMKGTHLLDFNFFLSSLDAARVRRVLNKLRLRNLDAFALTGSLAMEMHLANIGSRPGLRELNDIDIVVDLPFNAFPGSLAESFSFRHIHPNAAKGKMLIQAVDLQERLRIDMFSDFGGQMARSKEIDFQSMSLRAVSLEDLAARACAVSMGLERGNAVPSKHGRDLLHLLDVINPGEVETAWQDHRSADDPATFMEAATQVRRLIDSHPDLLIIPEYSKDVTEICDRCREIEPFRLGSASEIFSVLGYC